MGMTTVDKEHAVLQEKVAMEREKVKANLAKTSRELEDGPQITFEFMNNEDPPGSGSPTPLVQFTFGGKKFEIKHGDIATWPKVVVDHMNSLTRPVYGNKIDPVTGAIKSEKVTNFRRFTCLPVSEEPKKKRKDEKEAP